MPKGELLFEIRCEEIPARMLAPGVRDLATRIFEDLQNRGLGPKRMVTGFTPRRLVVTASGVAEREPDRVVREVGPPVTAAFDEAGSPTRAAEGFASRCGVAPEDLLRVETEKGEYVAVDVHHAGEPTVKLLAEILPRAARDVAWAKAMRWGSGQGPWVRPVHGVLALFGGEPVPFELLGVASGAETVGHPRLSPAPVTVSGWRDYRAKMARRAVVVPFEERREALASALEEAAAEAGGRLVEDPELVDKLTAICEVPGVVAGEFDDNYLSLPREVLATSLRDHQSALTVEGDDGLLPVFLTVMDRPDDPADRVRAGNEWVVEARLADARFFYDEDAKVPLAERGSRLERLTFHTELGSFADKTQRVEELVRVLAGVLDWEDELDAGLEAARLLKCDLTTEMVKEFTSLQGTVGGIYAREAGAPEAVWQAVYDQYLPVAAADEIPRTRAGQMCGIADRVDTLVGIFGLGLKPTGSRDPFGLRRAAQGLVRIVLEAGLPLDLDLVAARAVLLYEDRLGRDGDDVLSELRPFLLDRVRHLLGRQGYAYDEIEAALAVDSSQLPDLAARVRALHDVRDGEGFRSVVLAAKRIANILQDAPEHDLDEGLLREPAERALFEAGRELRSRVLAAEAERDFATCLAEIGSFADVLEQFFVEVLVMDEDLDLRHNRIGLLQSIERTLSRTARLTEMVVERAESSGEGA